MVEAMLNIPASLNEQWLFLYGTVKTESKVDVQVVEKPAQQVQMQKGEQASSCGSS